MLPAPGNLFTERTPFIGRQEERTALLAELLRPSRLLTITGPSGMGKTRLARMLAQDAAPHFAEGGGTWFCSLAGCSGRSEVETTVAQTLGVPLLPGQELAAAIAGRGKLLLILDNLEPVARDAAPLLERWLDLCPGLQILATSLVPAGVRGEVRFELGPLQAEDAVALYRESVRRAWANRRFSAAEREVVEELVQRLDRLPLAIELAAARVRVLPPRQLLARISERLALLEAGHEGHHGSLYRALSLSWELLSPAEERALARASVFAGGFSLEAAEALLAEGSEQDALTVLDGLRDKALVQLEENEVPRFTLYESVREFAALRLAALGEGDRMRERHAAFFAAAAEEQAACIDGPEASRAIHWLLAERDNLLAAHRWSLPRNPRAALRLGHSLSLILAFQGPVGLELEILESTLQAAQECGDARAVARTRWAWGRACKRHGKNEEALAHLEEGLDRARSCGDRTREGHILVESGAARLLVGERSAGVAELEQALRIGREEGDLLLEGIALLVLGSCEERAGHSPLTLERFHEALARFRRIGNLRYEGVALVNLGALQAHLGNLQLARQALQEARRIFRSLANPASESYVLLNQGHAELTTGEFDRAEAHFGEALERGRFFGNRHIEALAIGGLGQVELGRGDARQAEERLATAHSILVELGDVQQQATLQPFLAACAALLGRLDVARRGFQEATAAFERTGDEGSLAAVRLLRGFLDLAEAGQASKREASQALLERARCRLEAAEGYEGPAVEAFFIARRLLSTALLRQNERPTGDDASGLVVGAGASWFALHGAAPVDLRRRAAIRLMLQGLVEQRLRAPGKGLSQQALFELGWPGERVLPEAAAARVYSGIRTLRSLGLATALLRHADGYLLDPELPVIRSRARPAGQRNSGSAAG